VYQKAFLTAKFAKESQRAQTVNYLFIKPSPALCPVPFFAVMSSDQLLIQTEDAIFELTELNPILFDTSADFVGKMELLPVLWTHFRYLFLWEGSPEPDCIGVWRRLLHSGRMEHVFCEISILRQNLCNR